VQLFEVTVGNSEDQETWLYLPVSSERGIFIEKVLLEVASSSRTKG